MGDDVEKVDKVPCRRLASPLAPVSDLALPAPYRHCLLSLSSGVGCLTATRSFAQHIQRKYDITQKLGKGAYAVVFKAVDKKTKDVVAIKKIFDAFQNATDAQRTFREIAYLLMLQKNDVFSAKADGSGPGNVAHPNIIKLRNFHKAENDKDVVRCLALSRCHLSACALRTRSQACAASCMARGACPSISGADARTPDAGVASTWSLTSWRQTCMP